MSRSSEGRGGNFLPGLIFGVIAGAVAGLLFAPEKGEKTRARLQKEYEALRDQANQKLTELGALKEEHFDDLPSRMKAEMEEIKTKVTTGVKKAKTAVKQRLEEKALDEVE